MTINLDWQFGDDRKLLDKIKSLDDIDQLRSVARIALSKMAEKGVTITTKAKPNLKELSLTELAELLEGIAAEMKKRQQ